MHERKREMMCKSLWLVVSELYVRLYVYSHCLQCNVNNNDNNSNNFDDDERGCLQHTRSCGQGAVMYKQNATYQVQVSYQF